MHGTKEFTEEIDVKKVDELCMIKNITKAELGLSLGHSKNFFAHFYDGSTNRMAKSDYLLIKMMYGFDIKADKEEPKEEEITPPGEEPETKEITINRISETLLEQLKTIIRDAVYEALELPSKS